MSCVRLMGNKRPISRTAVIASMEQDPNGPDARATNRRLIASQPSWFIPPPHGWVHPVSGRHGWHPDPSLITFGQYLKRSRYLANMTQRASRGRPALTRA